MLKSLKIIPLATLAVISSTAFADDNYDLDDIRGWDLVPMEACLDSALDTIPGHARKLEMKMEGDDPVYEFDIQAKADGQIYNVECNAEEGFVTEVAREADANDPV
ncbi:MAG: PepSY domain-containing protein [Methylophaga sp.]|nr:PepSY domain-containing protein [Methylophaga sp.]